MYRDALGFKTSARACRERGDEGNARIMERASVAAYERARERAKLERLCGYLL
ncbi:MAG: hypothetical protein ACYTAN_01700 [Planctomycetota bacterium]|jgi:hypothetical protein